MLGILTWSGLHLRQEALARARVQSQRLADTLAAQQEVVAAGVQQLLIALAQFPGIQRRDPAVQPMLEELLHSSPQLLNVLVADREGVVWARAAGRDAATGLVGQRVLDRRYFQQAISSGRLSSGEYVVSRSTHRPTLHFAFPYRDAQGRVAGVIAVALALETYRPLPERSPLPPDSSYLLLDRRGIILARASDQERYQGKPFLPATFAAMLAAPDAGTDIAMTMVGDERVVAWRKLRLPGEPEPYLYIRVGLPVAAVLEAANHQLTRNLALSLALLLPALGLVVWAGKRWVVDPLRLLEAASARMASGDLAVRVGDQVQGGELGSLAAAFDRMAGQLALREQALAESQRSYREILDGTQDAIFVHDAATGRILDVNRGVERLFGYTREELLDDTVDLISVNEPPYTQAEAARRIGLAVTEGPQLFEWSTRRKGGERFWSEVRLGSATIGGALRVLATVHDISARKRAEAEAQRLQGQLQQAQKLESVGRLAGGVAHDINNMLSVILGEAELLQAELPEGHPGRKAAQEIEAAGTRSRDITRQLLAFSRKQVIAPRPVALADHLAGARSTLARLIGEDLRLTFSPAPGTWPVRIDPAQVDQVIMNLVVNARDAMPAGGEIRVETRNVTLDEHACQTHPAWRPGEYVRISVTDQGVGMDPETLAHAFEPFFTTKGTGHGTGLGLATVYGIATQNGGFVDVASAPGQGATFDVYLPRSPDPTVMADASRGSDAGKTRGAGGVILLVEDDEPVRRTALRMLESLGYGVVVADTPEQALARCRDATNRIDLLLTDVVMPGMKGPELRQRIEALRPGLPTVFMSGHTADAILAAGVAEGRVRFLQKPFSRNDLAERIDEALGCGPPAAGATDPRA
jgi:PAS domain S-box-containing protein